MFEVAGQQAPTSTGYNLTRPGSSNGCYAQAATHSGKCEETEVSMGSPPKPQRGLTPRGWKVHEPTGDPSDHTRNQEDVQSGKTQTRGVTHRNSRPGSANSVARGYKNKTGTTGSRSNVPQEQKPESYSVSGQHCSISASKVRIPTNGHHPSYVDELLFGGKEGLQDPGFPAPWEKPRDHKKKPLYVFDATDYKAVNARREERERTGSSTSRSQTPRSKKMFKGHIASYVDEGLFGPQPVEPTFRAPWDAKSSKRPFVFDTVDYTKPRPLSHRPETPKKPAWK